MEATQTLESIARWVGQASWQAAILVVIVLAVRALMGRRLSPAWRGALWALVAIRLIVPGVIGVAWLQPARMSPIAHQPVAAAIETAPSTAGGLTMTAQVVPAQPVAQTTPKIHPHWTPWIVTVWAIVAAAMIARLCLVNLRLAHQVRRMSPVTDENILRIAAECAREMAVRRPVRVVETAAVRSPAVCGLFRPVLMLPAGTPLTGEDLRLVLLHELAHVRRKDVWIEGIAGLLRALHWFNPLVWLAASACRSDRELACDEAVLRRVEPARRQDYGDCLLRVVAAVGNLRPHPAAVGVFGNKGNLHRRITMIATYPAQRSAIWSVVGLITFLAIGCVAATGPKKEAATAPTANQQSTAIPEIPEQKAPSAAQAAAQTALDKRIPELNFDAIPFSDVVDFLRDLSGTNLFVNWRALEAAGIEKNTPITVRLRDVRFGKAMETILHEAGGASVKLAYVLDDGVITISTADDLQANTVTRVYDIRDLLVDFDFTNFIGNTKENATAPTTQPTPVGREARIASIVSLIQETVAADSWRDNGGTIGSIRELSGQLVVAQTPENQQQVEALLEQLRDSRLVQVTLEARYVFVPQKTLDAANFDWLNTPAKDGGPVGTIGNQQVADFLRVIQKSGDSTVLTAPHVTFFNGQRALVAVTSSTPYISDYVTIHTKDGETRYEPRQSSATSGLTLDLQATVSADRKFVTTTIQSKLASLNGMKSRPFGTAADVAPAARLQVEEPDLTTQTTETTLSIADGQTAILVTLSPDPAPGHPKGQTFILIKPTIIIQHHTPAKQYPMISIIKK